MAEGSSIAEKQQPAVRVDGEAQQGQGSGTEGLKVGDMVTSNRSAEDYTYQKLVEEKNASNPENPNERVVETAQSQFGGTIKGEQAQQTGETNTQVAPQPKNTTA